MSKKYIGKWTSVGKEEVDMNIRTSNISVYITDMHAQLYIYIRQHPGTSFYYLNVLKTLFQYVKQMIFGHNGKLNSEPNVESKQNDVGIIIETIRYILYQAWNEIVVMACVFIWMWRIYIPSNRVILLKYWVLFLLIAVQVFGQWERMWQMQPRVSLDETLGHHR